MASSVSGSWCSWISVWPMSYIQEAFVHQFQYPFLVLVADGVLEQGAFLADPRAGLEAPVPCGQRQAVGPATAVAGEHENSSGFAPDFQLFQRADRLLLIQRGHGHDQCRRPAGKLRRLGVVGHRQEFPGWLVIQNAPFEPQGVAVVFRSEERRVGKECRSRWSTE